MKEKKIILVGEFNDISKNINKALADDFNVQLCKDDIGIFEGMVKIINPNLIVINLADIGNDAYSIYAFLRERYDNIPVISVGNSAEVEAYKEFYDNKKYLHILRPVTTTEILKVCKEVLNVKVEEKSVKKEEKKRNKSILVIDDSAIQLRNMKSWLGKKYSVSLAISGEQGIEMALRDNPGLIILDYEMPGYNGKEVLEKIRSLDEIKDTPVIFVTSVGDKRHIQEVIKLKPSGYILKPVELNKLMFEVEKILY